MRGVPSSTPPLPPNSKHVRDARIPLPTAWRRRLQCCSLTRANGGVLSRVPSQGLRKKAPGPSNMSILCFCVKDDDCGTLAESAAPPAAGRESVTSKQSGGLRGSRSDTVCNLDRRRAVAKKMREDAIELGGDRNSNHHDFASRQDILLLFRRATFSACKTR